MTEVKLRSMTGGIIWVQRYQNAIPAVQLVHFRARGEADDAVVLSSLSLA